MIDDRPDWIRISDHRFLPLEDEKPLIDQAKEMYERKTPMHAIGKILGVATNTIRYWRDNGWSIKRKTNLTLATEA